MSHSFKTVKLIKNYQVGKSASSKSLSRRLGDRPRHLGGIANVATGTFAGLMGRRVIRARFFLGRGRGGCCSLALNLALASLVLPVFLSGVSVYATGSSLSVSVSAGSGAYVNIPPTAEGKFGSAGPMTFSVSTNHASGYTLTAAATGLSFKDTEGANGDAGAVYTIDNLALPTGVTSISEDEFAGNAGYKNRWGYLPDKYYDSNAGGTVTGNVNYFPAPIDAAQTLDVTASANDPSSGGEANEYNVTIGTKLDYTVAQGAYTTTFTLAATVNPTPYTITYNANAGSDAVSDMPSNVSTTADGESIILSENIPIREGLIFRGWCTTKTADNVACSGTKYMMGGTYALDQTADTNEITLYAMWGGCDNNLYNLVACQVKKGSDGKAKTQTLADMQAVITEPTSNNPAADTSNSGVYKYDAATYGTASDASNDYDIYYFRGILDSTFTASDSYGGIPSTGDSAYYQNYVRLADTSDGRNSTCWRIVRTTGSGGTKMIYNGAWDSVAKTCANPQSGAAAGETFYNRGTFDDATNDYGTVGFIVYAGYNYNDDYVYKANAASNVKYTTATLNSILFNNNTPSNLRIKIEGWYDDVSDLATYDVNNKLENSAGWCDDRTTTDAPSMSDDTVPYNIGAVVTFGAYKRNVWNNGKMSLACPNVTGHDLLVVSNGLGKPLSPMTEDEAAMVGHGFTWNDTSPEDVVVRSSNFSYKSYLRSGAEFWLLSSYARNNASGAIGSFSITGKGSSGSPRILWENIGFRPTVSLSHSVDVVFGMGTATDPWVVNP